MWLGNSPESQNRNLSRALQEALSGTGVVIDDELANQYGLNTSNNRSGGFGSFFKKQDSQSQQPQPQPTRFFTNASGQGLFNSVDEAAQSLSFDDKGNLFYAGPNKALFNTSPQAPNFDAAISALKKRIESPATRYSGDGSDDEYMNRALTALNDIRRPYDSFSSLFSGKQYESFYNDETIKEAFPNENRPLTWQEYYNKSMEGITAQYSDGSTVAGPSVLALLRKEQGQQGVAQGLNLLKEIESNYDQYQADYRQSGTNFLGQKNMALAQQQAATDTDPTKRQVADYGVQGQYAPTGQGGWGRGNVQSSEGFQEQRRRGWGQTAIQGV